MSDRFYQIQSEAQVRHAQTRAFVWGVVDGLIVAGLIYWLLVLPP